MGIEIYDFSDKNGLKEGNGPKWLQDGPSTGPRRPKRPLRRLANGPKKPPADSDTKAKFADHLGFLGVQDCCPSPNHSPGSLVWRRRRRRRRRRRPHHGPHGAPPRALRPHRHQREGRALTQEQGRAVHRRRPPGGRPHERALRRGEPVPRGAAEGPAGPAEHVGEDGGPPRGADHRRELQVHRPPGRARGESPRPLS